MNFPNYISYCGLGKDSSCLGQQVASTATRQRTLVRPYRQRIRHHQKSSIVSCRCSNSTFCLHGSLHAPRPTHFPNTRPFLVSCGGGPLTGSLLGLFIVPSAASISRLSHLSALPYSQKTSLALRMSRDQAARQGLMFAGPDQLLLGILAAAETSARTSASSASSFGREGGLGSIGAGGDAAAGSAAALLISALGGGDSDSIREWLNEQTGDVPPLLYGSVGSGRVSSSQLRSSDVEFTAAAREVVRRAQEGAEAMGSRSVGTYHLALVLIAARTQHGQQQQQQLREEAGPRASLSTSSPTSLPGSPDSGAQCSESPGIAREAHAEVCAVTGMLPGLLRAVGADTAALYDQLVTLAGKDLEHPPDPGAAAATYQAVVTHLTETYKLQASLPYNERDEADFRRGPFPKGRGADEDMDELYE